MLSRLASAAHISITKVNERNSGFIGKAKSSATPPIRDWETTFNAGFDIDRICNVSVFSHERGSAARCKN